MSDDAPLFSDATLDSLRTLLRRYQVQGGTGPSWLISRASGDGISTPRTSAWAGYLTGYVVEPATRQGQTAPGQPAPATKPTLTVTSETLPAENDIITLDSDNTVRYRVGGRTASLLYPTYLVERL